MKKTCPLNGERLRQRMVYMAEVTTNTIYKEDYGAPDGEFKSRYNNDIQSFRDISHINDMELSKYLWRLKTNGTDYHLKLAIKRTYDAISLSFFIFIHHIIYI